MDGASFPGLSERARVLEASAATASEVAAVRRHTASHLRDCDEQTAMAALLVLSELVSNAVLHAGGADRVVVAVDAPWIRIDVYDHSHLPAQAPAVPPATGGRGLGIVEQLAVRWGDDPVARWQGRVGADGVPVHRRSVTRRADDEARETLESWSTRGWVALV